jgi:hypothetical protein
MPRRTKPKRELGIIIDEESMRDAMTLWVKKFHGIEIDPRKIIINTEDGLSATFIKKPQSEPKPEPKHESKDDSGDKMGISPRQE